MDQKEHLMVVAMEECAEVVKEMSKILRFGPDDYSPFDPAKTPNKTRLVHELADLMAVIEMLDPSLCPITMDEDAKAEFRALMDRKRKKLATYIEYSRDSGIVK